MLANHLRTCVAAAILGLLTSASCVERTEHITIGRDGSVVMELRFEGTEEELSRGDVMPSAASGWDVERSTKQDGDEVKHILKSRRRFEPREELPRSFAAPNDPDVKQYLDFPTTLRVERRPDGLYYYFHRTYTPRRWGYVEYWKNMFLDDDVQKLSEKPTEELTLEERGKIATAFAGIEAFKQIEFAMAAMAQMRPELPIERRLVAQRALLDFYEDENDHMEAIVQRCDESPEEERSGCYDEEVERILAEGYETLVESLGAGTGSRAGLGKGQLARFHEAYEQARREYEITDDLGGHVFEIDVRIPGEIIAHNAIDGDLEENDGVSRIRFKFRGDAFRDRTHELIVVSRLDESPRSGSRSRGNGSGR